MIEDVALAGIPRSGTTLVCALLNATPGTVALDEPIDPTRFASRLEGREAVAAIEAFFAGARASLDERGVAPSLHTAGRLTDNHFATGEDGGVRRLQVSRDDIAPDHRDVARLVAKHPVLFTTFLAELAEHMPCYAAVRNPLAVLASWNSVDIGPRSGRLPVAKANDPALAARLEGASDTIDRQLHLLSWFFERYEASLPTDAVIRYEEVVRRKEDGLVGLGSTPADPGVAIEDRNAQYDVGLMHRLADRLLSSDGAYWDYYSRADVEALL